jgi:hypothetical protein
VNEGGVLARPRPFSLAWGPLLRQGAPLLALGSVAVMLRVMGQGGWAALVGVTGLALCLARCLGTGARLCLGAGVLALALGIWLHPAWMWLLAQCLPALGMLAMAVHFGHTLRPGQEPLITRYARFDAGVRIEECAGYTRAVTAFWTLLFLAMAAIYASVPLGGAGPDDAWLLVAGGVVMLAVFLGEHVWRSLRFPQFGPATPLRTLRAMIAATVAAHG